MGVVYSCMEGVVLLSGGRAWSCHVSLQWLPEEEVAGALLSRCLSNRGDEPQRTRYRTEAVESIKFENLLT